VRCCRLDQPQLAALVKTPPEGDGWLHEIKFDGYRMHVHLDHESCMEVAVLRGAMSDIRHFAEHVIAERGVRHGRLMAVPVTVETESHAHGGTKGHRHLHTHPRRRVAAIP